MTPRRSTMPRRPPKILVITLRIAVFVAFVGVWEWAARVRGSPLTFPTASAVAGAFVRIIGELSTWQAVGTTLEAFALGYGLALVAGVGFGLLAGRFEPVRHLGGVYLRILLTAPLAPLIPLMIGIFGIGLAARVALVFIFCLATLAINTQVGVENADRDLIEMARSYGAKELLAFRRVRLPAAMPAIMAGVRLGTARAVVGMVVAELIIVSVGLGQLLNFYRGRFRAAEMFAVVIVILLVGLCLLQIVKLLERRLTRWQR